MKCKHCGYALWNLRARTCPECGNAFRISDYEFVPDSVRFCCPHCSQPYYGTDQRGLLEPRTFACVSCQKVIDLDEMVLLPAAGLSEEQTAPYKNPWIDGKRDGKGLFKRWISTVGMVLTKPADLGKAISTESSIWKACSFALYMLAVFCTVEIVISLIWGIGLGALMRAGGGLGSGIFAGAWISLFTATVLTKLVLFVVLVLILGCAAHAILRLSGPTQGGFKRTFESSLWSSGAIVLSLIPCAGMYVAPIWMLISGTIILCHTQKVSGGRAAWATILPFALVLIIAVGGVFYFVASTVSSVAGSTGGVFSGLGANAALIQSNAYQIQLQLITYQTQQGRLPTHAGELVGSFSAPGSAYLFAPSFTAMNYEKIGKMSLAGVATTSPTVLQRQIDFAVANQPADVVAHRVGEFVFTYHGITNPPQDMGLWYFVYSPSPNMPAVQSSRSISDRVVALPDGSCQAIKAADWSTELNKQNTLRAQHNLPPLPNPDWVKHDKPATVSKPLIPPSNVSDESSDQNDPASDDNGSNSQQEQQDP